MMSAQELSKSLVGMTDADACRAIWGAGFISRIATKNGQNRVFSHDPNPRRINLDVRDSLVVKAEPG